MNSRKVSGDEFHFSVRSGYDKNVDDMKSLIVWCAFIVLVMATIASVGLHRLIDINLFDAFLSDDYRNRSKRSRVYEKDYFDEVKPEDIMTSVSEIGKI